MMNKIFVIKKYKNLISSSYSNLKVISQQKQILKTYIVILKRIYEFGNNLNRIPN